MIAVSYNNIYMSKNHKQIIVFDTMNEAIDFVNNFFRYCQIRATQENNAQLIFQLMEAQNLIQFEDFDHPECETINFKELKK